MSTKLSVAIHILSLIEMGPPAQVTSDYIAASVNTNPVVVRRLMSQLKKTGLIHSKRGSSENYLLKSPSAISLYDIYAAVELDRDIFNVHQDPNPNCAVGAHIQAVLEADFAKVQQAMEQELQQLSLADVIHQLTAKRD